MSNVVDFGRQDREFDEASTWIARVDRGLSEAEDAELRCFLESPRAREQFIALGKHWDKLDVLARLSELIPPVERKRPKRAFYFASAAAVMLAVLTSVFMFAKGPLPPSTALQRPVASVYETAVGEQSTLNLPDGSIVLLNTDSQISVVFSASGRLVVLNKGEAHFEVAKDASRSFTVRAGDSLIQAVGTEFNVELSGARRVKLIVLEGVVRVKKQNGAIGDKEQSVPPALLATGQSVVAGTIATFDETSDSLARIDANDIDAALSWRTGSLVFKGESLENALAEVARYTNVTFVFLDDDIKHRSVAGRFRTGDVDDLLKSLQANFGITYQRVDDHKVLLSGK